MIWQTWAKLVIKIAKKIRDDYEPDIIIPSMNGGLVPCAIIASKLKIKDIRPVSIGRRNRQRSFLYPKDGNIGTVKNKKILIMEDDSFTGLSLDFAKKNYIKKGAGEVRTACVFKKRGIRNIDYFAKEVDKFPDYPWKKPYFGDRIIKYETHQ